MKRSAALAPLERELFTTLERRLAADDLARLGAAVCARRGGVTPAGEPIAALVWITRLGWR